jgi:hypothetical protein
MSRNDPRHREQSAENGRRARAAAASKRAAEPTEFDWDKAIELLQKHFGKGKR